MPEKFVCPNDETGCGDIFPISKATWVSNGGGMSFSMIPLCPKCFKKYNE